MRQPRLRRSARYLAQWHWRRAHFVQEELQAQRPKIFPFVTVIWFRRASGATRVKFHAPQILVHALASFLVDQFDLRTVNLVQRYARLARLNLGLQSLVELVERRFLQIDKLWQIQVVKLLQVMP